MVALRIHQWNAYFIAQSAWDRSSAPLGDATRWLVSGFQSPTMNTWIGFIMMAAYLIAAVSVWRTRSYPLAFRVLSLSSPLFLLAVGPQVSTARELVPDPGLAAALQRWLPRTWLLGLGFLLLILLRAWWMYAFVAASAGSPPP